MWHLISLMLAADHAKKLKAMKNYKYGTHTSAEKNDGSEKGGLGDGKYGRRV